MVKTTYFSWVSLLALIAVLGLSSCKKEPVACFSSNRATIIPNKFITFVNCSSNSIAWDWDFGDGGTSTDAAPNHSWAQKGIYTVSMTATSEKGDTDSFSGDIFVGDPGPVVLVFDTLRFPATQASELTVEMDGLASYSGTVTPFDLPVSINIDPAEIWTGTSYAIHVVTTLDDFTVNVNPQTEINAQMILRFSHEPFWSAYIGFTGR